MINLYMFIYLHIENILVLMSLKGKYIPSVD